MKQLSNLAVLAVATVVIAGCGGNTPTPAGTSGEQKGVFGVSYYVSVSRPVGGTITSADGRIDCGTAGGTKNLCEPVSFAWGATATFTATPDAGQFFQSWAGDCSGAVASGVGGCSLDTLTHGADKWVVAVFNPPDQLGHSRIPNPAQHSPLFFDFIKSKATPNPGAPKCTSCHGVNYDGVANAPSCTACHAAANHANWLTDCNFCHAFPPDTAGHRGDALATPPVPPVPSVATACSQCHPETVLASGAINAATGAHMNGKLDGGCNSCHGFPPATGVHLAHLSGSASAYGDLGTLQSRSPGSAQPTTASATYAFGCGNCHPLDPAQHVTTAPRAAKVVLDDGAGTTTLAYSDAPDLLPRVPSLKSRNAPGASYNTANRTCSGVYCHSSGQENPTYAVTPAWNGTYTTRLACNSCHANPPRYVSGGPNAGNANSHLGFSDPSNPALGVEAGHFLGMPGPRHEPGFPAGGSKHGRGQWAAGENSAPITCESCHYDTTDPASRGPSGFYWLDTTGNYQLPGGSSSRLVPTAPGYSYYGAIYAQLQCTACHGQGNPSAPVQPGRVLPLRHVNGKRDVVFDPRSTLPTPPTPPAVDLLAWLPAPPNRPTAPYWATNSEFSPYVFMQGWAPFVIHDGTTHSFGLGNASYDPGTKTCSNVGCHVGEAQPVWGTPYYQSTNGSLACSNCHP